LGREPVKAEAEQPFQHLVGVPRPAGFVKVDRGRDAHY
jgi:hypothetical protein